MLVPITPTGKAHPYLKKFRRRMRHNPTPAEALLSKALHVNKVQFSRQQVFYDSVNRTGYIADFWIWKIRTIVEYDGGYHEEPSQKIADKVRDRDFLAVGISTIRIPNKEIEEDVKIAVENFLNISAARLTRRPARR